MKLALFAIALTAVLACVPPAIRIEGERFTNELQGIVGKTVASVERSDEREINIIFDDGLSIKIDPGKYSLRIDVREKPYHIE